METTTARQWSIRARRSEVKRLAHEKLGITTTTALADRIGVDRTNLSRVLNGHHTPGEVVIAGLLGELGASFEDVFTISHTVKT